MPSKSSIAIFLAATSALAISSTENTTLKASENDLGGLKELYSVDTKFVKSS